MLAGFIVRDEPGDRVAAVTYMDATPPLTIVCRWSHDTGVWEPLFGMREPLFGMYPPESKFALCLGFRLDAEATECLNDLVEAEKGEQS